jgi:hypothetical protein
LVWEDRLIQPFTLPIAVIRPRRADLSDAARAGTMTFRDDAGKSPTTKSTAHVVEVDGPSLVQLLFSDGPAQAMKQT